MLETDDDDPVSGSSVIGFQHIGACTPIIVKPMYRIHWLDIVGSESIISRESLAYISIRQIDLSGMLA